MNYTLSFAYARPKDARLVCDPLDVLDQILQIFLVVLLLPLVLSFSSIVLVVYGLKVSHLARDMVLRVHHLGTLAIVQFGEALELLIVHL